MDIYALQAFIEVSKHRSFSLAAGSLYLTQPAVSKRIAGLEKELHVRLFDRIGRQVVLTEAGSSLLPKAQNLLNDLADLKRLASNLRGTVTGILVMGTSHHIGLHRLPAPLKAFTSSYPEVQLDIRFMDSEAACRMVETGELEIAVVTLPTRDAGKLHLRKIWDDPLAFVVAADHPLANTVDLSLEELTAYPAVLPGKTTYTRSILDAEITKYNLDLTINMSTNYLETIKMLVSANQGWSLLPETMLDNNLVALQLPVRLERELGIVVHAKRTLSNAASALVDILQDR
jgi:DNA-binding transcriptional LysR family regulator